MAKGDFGEGERCSVPGCPYARRKATAKWPNLAGRCGRNHDHLGVARLPRGVSIPEWKQGRGVKCVVEGCNMTAKRSLKNGRCGNNHEHLGVPNDSRGPKGIPAPVENERPLGILMCGVCGEPLAEHTLTTHTTGWATHGGAA